MSRKKWMYLIALAAVFLTFVLFMPNRVSDQAVIPVESMDVNLAGFRGCEIWYSIARP